MIADRRTVFGFASAAVGDRAGACRSWARYRSAARQAAENASARLAAFNCDVR
jgi:hypothetical protein